MSKRREKTDAKLSRRELIKAGLLSSGVTLLSSKSIRAAAATLQTTQSPPTTPFVEELPIMPEAQPAPGLVDPLPNAANHQRYDEFLPQKFYEINQVEALHSFHPELPPNPIWGYNGVYPGPTFRARYGEPALVRFHNNLPPNHVGFGIPSVITHLHNGHTASESDGFPGDFYEVGQFKDHHYPNTYAGGDEREALSTLWYHDHRVDFTSQNVYKGLAGFYLLFDERDSGDEQDTHPQALRLPSGEFDVPLIFQDMRFTAGGEQFYDSFNNNDGLLGDKFLVNGKIQPFMRVIPRKYRFRLLNGSLSRFYEFFLSNGLPFIRISSDGNLLPAPLIRQSIRLAPAERADVIVDFSASAFRRRDTIFIQNRLEQTNGRGPTGRILTPGTPILRFDVSGGPARDPSRVPDKLREIPPTTTDVATRRSWVFQRRNGVWTVNNRVFDFNRVDATTAKGAEEIWTIRNQGNGWSHPIHIHFEEFQILSRNGGLPPAHERARKDVVVIGPNETVDVFIRFRDFFGKYPMHCHNLVHEDHAMMMRWDIGS